MISFIIPAYNEAFEIERCLHSIFDAARKVGDDFEVIVVNDASTDATPAMARDAGATVVDVQLHKISGVRNAGARAARGSMFIFVDADTRISERTLRAALAGLTNGAAGGGACVTFDQPVTPLLKIAIWAFSFLYMRCIGWAAGCFVYTTREAFETVGGFDESLFAGEEIAFSNAVKRIGRFVVLRETVTTSARKLRLYSPLRIFPLLGRFLIHGRGALRDRRGLEWWYEGKRESSEGERRQERPSRKDPTI